MKTCSGAWPIIFDWSDFGKLLAVDFRRRDSLINLYPENLPPYQPVGLAFAPYGREPRLLVARESLWTVVMPHLNESGSANVIAPGVEIEEAAIAVTA